MSCAQHLLLMRHTESFKNVLVSFASNSGTETLTESGIREAQCIGERIGTWAARQGCSDVAVYSSDSQRSLSTAEVVARAIRVRVKVVSGFASIGSGYLGGRSEEEAGALEPSYISALRLYRAGLFNSYLIPEFEGKEGKMEFEERIRSGLAQVLSGDEDVKVLVAQRSPITAVLIHFARLYHQYPRDYFGYLQLDLGRISWVRRVDMESWCIEQVNVESRDLGVVK